MDVRKLDDETKLGFVLEVLTAPAVRSNIDRDAAKVLVMMGKQS
jgi:hypothetical protein